MITLVNKMTCRIDNYAGHGKAGSARPELKPKACTLHSDRGAMVDLSHESGPKCEAGVGVQNVERSRTSFYMSSVSGSCLRLAGRSGPQLVSVECIYGTGCRSTSC